MIFFICFLCLLESGTDLVGSHDSGSNHVGSDGEGHGVDGLLGDAGLLGDQLQLLSGDLGHADVSQADGQADGLAEAQDLVDLLHGSVLQNQLDQGTEGDLLTVGVVVGTGQNGQTVMDSVGGSQTAGLEAQAGQQDVGLDDVLQSGSDNVA